MRFELRPLADECDPVPDAVVLTYGDLRAIRDAVAGRALTTADRDLSHRLTAFLVDNKPGREIDATETYRNPE